VKGFDFRLSQDAVRHVFDHHGSDLTEAPRGQRPVTLADFGMLPAILSKPDTIEGPGTSPTSAKPLSIAARTSMASATPQPWRSIAAIARFR